MLEIAAGRYLTRPGRRLTIEATVLSGRLEVIAADAVVRRLGHGDSIAPAALMQIAGPASVRAAVDSTILVTRPTSI